LVDLVEDIVTVDEIEVAGEWNGADGGGISGSSADY
jgi:hypothetical protein